MAKFEVLGLDDLMIGFKEIANEMPDVTAKAMTKVAKKFKAEVRNATPKRTGEMRKKYKIRTKGYGAERVVIFYSASPHFHLIERGHRVVPRKTKSKGRNKTTTGSGKKFVQGVGMLENALNEYEKIYPQEIKRAFDEVLKK